MRAASTAAATPRSTAVAWRSGGPVSRPEASVQVPRGEGGSGSAEQECGDHRSRDDGPGAVITASRSVVVVRVGHDAPPPREARQLVWRAVYCHRPAYTNTG